RQRRPDDERHRRPGPGRRALQQRLAQRLRHLRSILPAGAQRPPAQRHVPDVVHDDEAQDGRETQPERHPDQRQPRGERQPPRPHEPVSERAERPAQRRAETLDLLGWHAVQFRPRRRADGEAAQIRVRIEEMRSPRHGGAVRHTVVPTLAPQVPQQRLLGDADAHALHALVVPGALHGEQAEQAADEPGPGTGWSGGAAHRSHATIVPPTTPAANQRRLGPRPTRRSVPAAPAASAAPTAATLSSATPCGGRTPARYARATCASTRPSAVTTAARTASRTIPAACSRSSTRGSPASSAAVARRTARVFSCRSACRLSPPAIPVISPTNAPSPSPSVPAAACAALTAATVAGPYSG